MGGSAVIARIAEAAASASMGGGAVGARSAEAVVSASTENYAVGARCIDRWYVCWPIGCGYVEIRSEIGAILRQKHIYTMESYVCLM